MAKEILPTMSEAEVQAVIDTLDLNDPNSIREASKQATPKQAFMIAMPYGLKKQPDMKAKLEGIEGTVMWVIEGDGGGTYSMIFGNADIKVKEGEEADPRATVTLSIDTWSKIANGETNPPMAFMQGLMRVTGDMGFLIQLQNVMPQM